MESSEEDFSDDIVDIFGEREDADDFSGFNFTLPDNINWETDEDGAKMLQFYEQNPRKVFSCGNVGPRMDQLPGEKRPVDIFQLFISKARWTNEWFQVKKTTEPNKHKVPFASITDIAELKAYIGIILAMNQNIDLPRYERYFHQDESKLLLLTPGFHKVFSAKRFAQLNRYIFL